MSQHHTHHITSVPALLATFCALIFLTVLTVVLSGPPFDFGEFDMAVTLTIATAKAALVALIFMQLLHDKLFNSVILVGSLLFVALFMGFAVMDSLQYQPQVSSYAADRPEAPVTEVSAD
jgi:cytochrome c oxidase subunit 4